MNTLQLEKQLATQYKYKKLPDKLAKQYHDLYRENIPSWLHLEGGDCLYTGSGTLLASSYDRIVVGDYGAFVEFSRPSCDLVIERGQEYRLTPEFNNVKYNWVTVNDGSNIKIYHQRRTVSYADYVPGKFYVSVHEVFPMGGQP